MDKIKSLKEFSKMFDEYATFDYNDPVFKLLENTSNQNHRIVITKGRQCGKSYASQILNYMKTDPFLNNPIYIKKLFLRNGTYNFIINSDCPKYVLIKLKEKWASTNIEYILDKIKRKCIFKKDITEIEKAILDKL